MKIFSKCAEGVVCKAGKAVLWVESQPRTAARTLCPALEGGEVPAWPRG